MPPSLPQPPYPQVLAEAPQAQLVLHLHLQALLPHHLVCLRVLQEAHLVQYLLPQALQFPRLQVPLCHFPQVPAHLLPALHLVRHQFLHLRVLVKAQVFQPA